MALEGPQPRLKVNAWVRFKLEEAQACGPRGAGCKAGVILIWVSEGMSGTSENVCVVHLYACIRAWGAMADAIAGGGLLRVHY